MSRCSSLFPPSRSPLFLPRPPHPQRNQFPRSLRPLHPASLESVDDRIFGVIPSYLAVEDPRKNVVPLTAKQKFALFAKETLDPFTFASSAAGAALSQIDNDNPKYGHGAGPYAERFGAAMADVTTQNFFSDAVLASLLHEDPALFPQGAGIRRLVSSGLCAEPRGGHANGPGNEQIQFFGNARNGPGDRALQRLLSR